MLPDQVSNPGPLTFESGALPIALRGPANAKVVRDKGLTFTSAFYKKKKKKKKQVTFPNIWPTFWGFPLFYYDPNIKIKALQALEAWAS